MSAARKNIPHPVIALKLTHDGTISVTMTDSDTGEYFSDFTLSVDAAREMANGLASLIEALQ
jgi:hypothetical protein